MIAFSWLWIPITIFAAFVQNIRSAAQKHLTAELSTISVTMVRFLFGLPFGLLYLWFLNTCRTETFPEISLEFIAYSATAGAGQIIGTAAGTLASTSDLPGGAPGVENPTPSATLVDPQQLPPRPSVEQVSIPHLRVLRRATWSLGPGGGRSEAPGEDEGGGEEPWEEEDSWEVRQDRYFACIDECGRRYY